MTVSLRLRSGALTHRKRLDSQSESQLSHCPPVSGSELNLDSEATGHVTHVAVHDMARNRSLSISGIRATGTEQRSVPMYGQLVGKRGSGGAGLVLCSARVDHPSHNPSHRLHPSHDPSHVPGRSESLCESIRPQGWPGRAPPHRSCAGTCCGWELSSTQRMY